MPPQTRLTPDSFVDMALLGALWGGSFFAVAIALREMGPLTAVAHRVFWAALILWGLAQARGLPVPRDARLWVGFAVMGLLNNVVPFGLLAWAQLHVESGLVSILNASTAIFGALVAAALLADERLTARRALGVGLGFCGVIALVGAEALAGLSLRSAAQGAVALAAVSYAFASVWARVRLRGCPPVTAAAGMLTCSTLMAAPLALAVEGAPRLDLSAGVWAAIVWYAVVCTALSYLLYYRLVAKVGAANTMLVTLLIPPVAVTLGALFLGERLGPEAAAGYALLAAGLAVIDGRAPAFLWARLTRRKPAA